MLSLGMIGSFSGWEPVWQVEGRNHPWMHPTRSTMALLVCVSFIALVKTDVRLRSCVALRATEALQAKEWRTIESAERI